MEGVWKASGILFWSSKLRKKRAPGQNGWWPGGMRRPLGNLLEGEKNLTRTGESRKERKRTGPEKELDKILKCI